MLYIYRSEDLKDNLILERFNKNQVILRAQKDEMNIPLIKCSDGELNFIFSTVDGFVHNHITKIDWKDTRHVIIDILGENLQDTTYRPTTVYKPTANMNYRVQLVQDEDNNKININFEVKYTLWKIDKTTGNVEEITTPIQHFEYRFTYEKFRKIITGVLIKDEFVATDIINK